MFRIFCPLFCFLLSQNITSVLCVWTLYDPGVKCDYRVSESGVSNSNTCKSFATNCKFFSSKASFSPPPILGAWCQRVSKGWRGERARERESEETKTKRNHGFPPSSQARYEICCPLATPGGHSEFRAVERFATKARRPTKYANLN